MGTMTNKTKYTRNNRIKRDCEKCKNYGGMLSKHYFLCLAEVYEMQKRVTTRDIYDIRVMKKGACFMYKPKEVTNDLLLNYVAMDEYIEENVEDLPDKE